MIEQVLTGTSAGAVAGVLSGWLMKVWANRVHQKDRVHYEEQLQKKVFVHRLQFEKEFEVYLGLWKELLEAGRAASEYRELKVDSGKSREQELEGLRLAINRFKDRVYDYRPFYAPRIYDLTTELLKKLRIVHRYEANRARAAKREDDIEQCLDEINGAIPGICDAIRERVFPKTGSATNSRAG